MIFIYLLIITQILRIKYFYKAQKRGLSPKASRTVARVTMMTLSRWLIQYCIVSHAQTPRAKHYCTAARANVVLRHGALRSSTYILVLQGLRRMYLNLVRNLELSSAPMITFTLLCSNQFVEIRTAALDYPAQYLVINR